MEVSTNGDSVAISEDLSWALQIGDLETVKEHIQKFAKENKVII